MNDRLVITGMGAVTPIGIGMNKYWTNLIGGKCGIDYIESIDTSQLPVKIAGEVKNLILLHICRERNPVKWTDSCR